MKDQIKEWLRAYNHDRPWLAAQIGVKPRTVDNWLSSPQVIPDGKLTLIKRLMDDDEAAEAVRKQKLQPTAQVYSLEVDLPTFRLFSKAAVASQKTIEEWSVTELERAAKEWESSQIESSLATELEGQPDEPIEHIPKVDDDLLTLIEGKSKPSASTVTPEAKPSDTVAPLKPLPSPTAQAAASPLPTIKLPPQHIAKVAEDPADYQAKPKRSS